MAPPLVILLQAGWARVLFPFLMLLGLWLLLAAFWPLRAAAERRSRDGLSLERTEPAAS